MCQAFLRPHVSQQLFVEVGLDLHASVYPRCLVSMAWLHFLIDLRNQFFHMLRIGQNRQSPILIIWKQLLMRQLDAIKELPAYNLSPMPLLLAQRLLLGFLRQNNQSIEPIVFLDCSLLMAVAWFARTQWPSNLQCSLLSNGFSWRTNKRRNIRSASTAVQDVFNPIACRLL